MDALLLTSPREDFYHTLEVRRLQRRGICCLLAERCFARSVPGKGAERREKPSYRKTKRALRVWQSAPGNTVTVRVRAAHWGSGAVVKQGSGGGVGGRCRLDTQELFRTYILDILSGYGLVVNIDRPLGYNYDIQPFHPRSVLQGLGGGWRLVERKHDRKTETLAAKWSFRSMAPRPGRTPSW